MRLRMAYLITAIILPLFFICDLSAENYTYIARRMRNIENAARLELVNILSKNNGLVSNESGLTVARLNETGTRVIVREGYNPVQVLNGIRDGWEIRSQREIIDTILASPETAAIGMTGGGDCAGISTFISELWSNLRERGINLNILGVRFAKSGLIVPYAEFGDNVILIDDLLLADFATRSSTPLGSDRGDPFKVDSKKPQDAENAYANIAGFKVYFATGGDDHLKVVLGMPGVNPEIIAVAAPKSMDGDVAFVDADGTVHYIQTLGFRTAVGTYRPQVFLTAKVAAEKGVIVVLESFGRLSGRVLFETFRTTVTEFDSPEVQQLVEEFGDRVMSIVPEKDVSLVDIAREILRINSQKGSQVTGVAEGFVPTDMNDEMVRLNSIGFAETWNSTASEEQLSIVNNMLYDEDSPFYIENEFLRIMFRDNRSLAVDFVKMMAEVKYDTHGNVAKLAGIGKFIAQAVRTYAKNETGEVPEVAEDSLFDGLDSSVVVDIYRENIANIGQNGATHRQYNVYPVHGNDAYKIVSQATNISESILGLLAPELKRKMLDYRSSNMVTEIGASLESVAKEALEINSRVGSLLAIVPDGFIPLEMSSEIKRLQDTGFKDTWAATVEEEQLSLVNDMLYSDRSPHYVENEFLRSVLQDDKVLAIKFAEICATANYGSNGQIENTDLFSDIYIFVMQAIKTAGRIHTGKSLKVNDASNLRYIGRGATPSVYDIEMASNLAEAAANVVAQGNPGAYIVAYEEGMNPFTQQPIIFRPVEITSDNNLLDSARYPDEFLRANGVFWKDEWEDNTP